MDEIELVAQKRAFPSRGRARINAEVLEKVGIGAGADIEISLPVPVNGYLPLHSRILLSNQAIYGSARKI